MNKYTTKHTNPVKIYKPKSATFPPLTGVFSLSFFEFAVHEAKKKER